MSAATISIGRALDTRARDRAGAISCPPRLHVDGLAPAHHQNCALPGILKAPLYVGPIGIDVVVQFVIRLLCWIRVNITLSS